MSTSARVTLTDQEVEFLGNAWMCSKGNANFSSNIDYEKLAKAVGHTNPASTRNTMARIEKKLKNAAGNKSGGERGSSAPSTPKTPKGKNGTPATGTKRKEATPNDTALNGYNDDDDAEIPAVETTPSRGPPKKSASAAPATKRVKTVSKGNDASENAETTPPPATRSRSGSAAAPEPNRFTPINKKGGKGKNNKSMAVIKEEDADQDVDMNLPKVEKDDDGEFVV